MVDSKCTNPSPQYDGARMVGRRGQHGIGGMHRIGGIGRIGYAAVTAILAASLAISSTVATSRSASADQLVADFTIPTPGPLGAVTVIGDSVMLGSGITDPTLGDQLVANGWGPVRFRAGVGYSAGNKPVKADLKASYWIQRWRSEGWDAPTVVVNIGANDSGVCGTNVQCARDAILHVVNTIGPGHRIWWPKITRVAISPYLDQQITWNAALDQIAAERDDFWTWDWPLVMATEGYSSPDSTHLSAAGYRKRSARMAQQITADLATGRRVGDDAPLPAATAAASTFVPLAPSRAIDTRLDPPGRLGAGDVLRVELGALLPTGSTAVVANITAADPSASGYLAAHPCGTTPGASSVNHTAGRSRGALAITPVGPDGAVCVYAHTPTDVVIDVQGAFVAGDGESTLVPTAPPQRLLDTRQSGRAGTVRVATPAGAEAVSVNLTATGAEKRGFLRAYPCDGELPAVSNVNFGPGESVAGSAFVPTSAGDEICVQASAPVDVVVDLTGTFAPGEGLSFLPVPPTRTIDTRDGTGGWGPVHGAGQTIDVRVAPPNAEAVSGTLTMVRPTLPGYLTAHGCGAQPPTSSVNATPGVVLANALTIGVSDTGRLCVFSSRLAQTVFDTTGWWVR